MIKNDLNQLEIPEKIQKEIGNEIEGAEIQLREEKPDKEKISKKLKSATNVLKEMGALGKGAVAFGNLIGKAIAWCGVQWIDWVV